LKTILRWIAVVPAAFAAYILAKAAQTMFAYPFLPQLVSDLNAHRSLGSHVVMGPIFVTYREILPAFVGMFVAHRIAPLGQKHIGLIINATAWLAVSLFGLATMHSIPRVPGAVVFRTYLEIAAQAVGMVTAFIHFRSREQASLD
jgi:hypothetical protein